MMWASLRASTLPDVTTRLRARATVVGFASRQMERIEF